MRRPITRATSEMRALMTGGINDLHSDLRVLRFLRLPSRSSCRIAASEGWVIVVAALCLCDSVAATT
jgi:hypothetical protein